MSLGSLFDALEDAEDNRAEIIRAPMSLAGCKYSSLQHMLPHIPANRDGVFVDVFGGTGQVILGRYPTKLDVYNDRHSGLVAFYKCMQSEEKTLEIIERLKLMPHARETFDWCKKTWPTSDSDVDRAVKYYYVLTLSFSAAGRHFARSTSAASNSPTRIISQRLPLFWQVHQRFQNKVQVENLDWRQVFRDFDGHDTVFYCDPPYWESDIYEWKMTKREHEELCERIHSLEGFVALSGYANPVYDNYPWDEVHSWELKTSATSQAKAGTTKHIDRSFSREKRLEYLWIKDFS